MKKLKDIFYDYNDVIIAFAILVIAALLIIWRLDVILDYPDKILEKENPPVETPLVDEDADKDSDKDEDSDKDSDKDANKDEDKDSDKEPALWVDGKLSKDVKVTVSSSATTATEAIQGLVDAGLFDSYSDYQTVCTDMGLNHESVSAGTFTFKAGSTKKDIADAVNWS